MLQRRIDSLRVLASNTDGVAFLNSNDLRGQMRRLAADFTSYYLLGYSSTNAKLDGGLPDDQGEGRRARVSKSGRGAAIVRRAPRSWRRRESRRRRQSLRNAALGQELGHAGP